MHQDHYTSDKNGELVKATGRIIIGGIPRYGEYTAFVPNPLPASITYDDRLLNRATDAALALGELRSAAARLASPILISGICNSFLRKEAHLTSRIEGTVVPLEDVLFHDDHIPKTRSLDLQEVLNFVMAQGVAMQQIKAGHPLTPILFKEVHRTLLSNNVRGRSYHPGEYRDSQNHIGPRGCDTADAHFVPPPNEHLQSCLDNLFWFLEEGRGSVNSLITIALSHYQFEAIHPFEDGNGRIGRLAIMLQFIRYGLLDEPLIYLSAYFDRHQDQYYDLLLKVSTHGDWQSWLEFFLTGIQHQAIDARDRCDGLRALNETYKSRLSESGASGKLVQLIDYIFTTFSVTARKVEQELGVHYTTANQYIQRLVDLGILRMKADKKNYRVFYPAEMLDVIERG